MPRPKKDRSPNALRPRARDLFGQVPVTIDEVENWVKIVAPHMAHNPNRMARYAKGYNVAEKIRQAKINGQFWALPFGPG